MIFLELLLDPIVPKPGFNDKVNLGWLALYLPVAGFAGWRIIRGFRAERHAEKSLGEDIATVRDACLTQEINPVMAEISVSVRRYMVAFQEADNFMPGEPGDPRAEAERVLGYHVSSFATPIRQLEALYAKVARADECHDRKVAECQRTAVAIVFFVAAWTYTIGGLSLTTTQLPLWSYIVAIVAGCSALGWATAEWWDGTKAGNQLSRMVRAANQGPVGGTN